MVSPRARRAPSKHAIEAGLTYFAVVFGAGFLLGTFRVLVLLPIVTEQTAVQLELPVMLAISWFASRRLIGWFQVEPDLRPRLVMGALAFALLLGAEMALSAFLFGRTLQQHLALYRSAVMLQGLVSQLAFAMYPAIQLLIGSSREKPA